jgi:hypothetical protein
MKYIFPILALVGALVGQLSANDLESLENDLSGSISGSDTGVGGRGGELVAEAAEILLEPITLQARVRQRVFLFNRRLTGSGTYYQAQARDRVVSRLDVKLPMADKVLVLQQISDGDYLWTQRDLDKRTTIGRVDLRRVRNSPVGANLTPAQQLAMGGLVQLLEGLHAHFEFEDPRAAQLGELPVWVLHGRWRGASGVGASGVGASGVGARRGGEGRGGDTSMPQVPDSVVLLLSRSDSLPLFPFRVEYARHRLGADGQSTRVPIMAVDFFEVRVGVELDGRLFTFTAGDRDLNDDTERFLREIGG